MHGTCDPARPTALWIDFRAFLRLIALTNRLEFCLSHLSHSHDSIVTVHRFKQTVSGRTYLIEAMRVDQDRWRAYLAGIQGGPTALMPFYGATAEEAVHRLTDWLTLAHQVPTVPV